MTKQSENKSISNALNDFVQRESAGEILLLHFGLPKTVPTS